MAVFKTIREEDFIYVTYGNPSNYGIPLFLDTLSVPDGNIIKYKKCQGYSSI